MKREAYVIRSGPMIKRAALVPVLASLLASGCFFDLPELTPIFTPGGSGGVGGADQGGEGGGLIGGGDNGGGGNGGTPVVMNECIEGETVDCDGDPSNGCETSFLREQRDPAETLPLPMLTIQPDGFDDEWEGVPLVGVFNICEQCDDTAQDRLAVVTTPFELPDSDDLLSAFRMAWNNTNLFLWYQASDDDIVLEQTALASAQDGFELLVDGENLGPGGADDHQLFLAVNETAEELGAPGFDDVEVKTRLTARCYFIETRISFTYISGQSDGMTSGMPNDILGFDLATNDYDSATAGGPAERQSQVFFRDPGAGYWFMPDRQFGTIELVPSP